MSQPIRGQGGHLVFQIGSKNTMARAGHLVFQIGSKNTNLVEGVEILLSVKFR